MGFFGNIISAVVKTALTPVAVIKDAGSIIVGDDPNATKQLIDGATNDVTDAIDDITGN